MLRCTHLTLLCSWSISGFELQQRQDVYCIWISCWRLDWDWDCDSGSGSEGSPGRSVSGGQAGPSVWLRRHRLWPWLLCSRDVMYCYVSGTRGRTPSSQTLSHVSHACRILISTASLSSHQVVHNSCHTVVMALIWQRLIIQHSASLCGGVDDTFKVVYIYHGSISTVIFWSWFGLFDNNYLQWLIMMNKSLIVNVFNCCTIRSRTFSLTYTVWKTFVLERGSVMPTIIMGLSNDGCAVRLIVGNIQDELIKF